MRNIILAVLLASGSLVAAESVQSNKSGVDGEAFYKKRCSVCHGANGEKTPLKGMIPIASMDATSLARKVRAYRDQDERHGTAHSIYRENQVMKEATSSLSNQQIGAIAQYINGLIK